MSKRQNKRQIKNAAFAEESRNKIRNLTKYTNLGIPFWWNMQSVQVCNSLTSYSGTLLKPWVSQNASAFICPLHGHTLTPIQEKEFDFYLGTDWPVALDMGSAVAADAAEANVTAAATAENEWGKEGRKEKDD